MTDAAISARLDALTSTIGDLTSTIAHLSSLVGARLTRAEVLARLRISRNTLATRIERDGFPTPGRDGKWLLAEVIEWERGAEKAAK